MLKQLSICAALLVLATGAVNAQQREAVVQRVGVAGAEFDLAVVSAKPSASSLDWREEMDPHLVHVGGGKLLLAYDYLTQSVFPQIESMLAPSCVFQADSRKSELRSPVAIYVVPKAD